MENSLQICVLLICLFIFLSLTISTVLFTNDSTGNMMKSDGNKSWLMISIVACIPAFLNCSIDLLSEFLFSWKMKILPPQLAEKTIQAMKIITILAPNCIHYSLLSSEFRALDWISRIQDEILFTQSFTVITFVVCGIISRPSNFYSSVELNHSVEMLSIVFMIALTSFKLFLLLALLISNSYVKFLFFLLSFICLSFGMAILPFISFKLSIFYSSKQVKISNTSKFSMTHDFYRLLGACLFAIYTFAVFIQANQFLSPYPSGTSKLHLIGQTLMVMYMNVVDHRSVKFRSGLER